MIVACASLTLAADVVNEPGRSVPLAFMPVSPRTRPMASRTTRGRLRRRRRASAARRSSCATPLAPSRLPAIAEGGSDRIRSPDRRAPHLRQRVEDGPAARVEARLLSDGEEVVAAEGRRRSQTRTMGPRCSPAATSRSASSPWCKSVVAPRPTMRPDRKARNARISPVFER